MVGGGRKTADCLSRASLSLANDRPACLLGSSLRPAARGGRRCGRFCTRQRDGQSPHGSPPQTIEAGRGSGTGPLETSRRIASPGRPARRPYGRPERGGRCREGEGAGRTWRASLERRAAPDRAARCRANELARRGRGLPRPVRVPFGGNEPFVDEVGDVRRVDLATSHQYHQLVDGVAVVTEGSAKTLAFDTVSEQNGTKSCFSASPAPKNNDRARCARVQA